MVTKIGRKYKHLMHGDQILKEKCVRAFASLNPKAGGLQKESIRTGELEKVANSPERCFLFNDSVDGVKVPAELDKQFYINMAKKRLAAYGVVL